MAANVVSQARGKKQSQSSSGAVWENVKSLAGAVLIYLVIKTFLFEAYRIPSGSMIPTLLVGDWLFVNKAVYGAAHPVHGRRISRRSRSRSAARSWSSARRRRPISPEDPNPTLVKRLVGMPGDTLYMRAGMLFVNGVAQRQGYGIAEPARRQHLAARRDASAVRLAARDRAETVALRSRARGADARQLGPARDSRRAATS